MWWPGARTTRAQVKKGKTGEAGSGAGSTFHSFCVNTATYATWVGYFLIIVVEVGAGSATTGDSSFGALEGSPFGTGSRAPSSRALVTVEARRDGSIAFSGASERLTFTKLEPKAVAAKAGRGEG